MAIYLTDLATAARKSGLAVVEVPGWQARGHGGLTSAKGLVEHWTATPASTRPADSYPSLAVVRDGRAGLPGPLAQLGLGRDGTVYVIAAGLAYHAGEGYWPGIGANGNANMIGIECEGAGGWTAAQLDAYPRLCRALCQHYAIAVGNVIGHHEWAPKRKSDINTWPGGMNAFRVAVSTPAPPQNTTKELDMPSGILEPRTDPANPGRVYITMPPAGETGGTVRAAKFHIGTGWGNRVDYKVWCVAQSGAYTNPPNALPFQFAAVSDRPGFFWVPEHTSAVAIQWNTTEDISAGWFLELFPF